MSRGGFKVGVLSFVLGLLVLPLAAPAAPVSDGTVTFNNDDTPPFDFIATLTYRVYEPGDPDNPVDPSSYPTVNTDYTYVYTFANDAGSFVPLDGLDVELREGVTITASGNIDDGNPATVPPSAITVGSTLLGVDFFYASMIYPGSSSEPFFYTSPFAPGDVVLSAWFDGVSEDEIGSLAGPSDIGGMSPRTIGFWKNQYQDRGPNFYTPEQLDVFLTAAVALSGGVFVDELDLRTNLTSKGARDMLTRAKQQFAALLLNITSGLLGQDVQIYTDLTTATTVRGARIEIQNLILGGTELERAKNIADDINNGIGVGTPS
jgi:hypothetical protein